MKQEIADGRYIITTQVQTLFLEEYSDLEEGRYAFAYTITIKNDGTVASKLMSRHWIICDSNDKIQEVQGDGVVGEQPFLRPGEAYCYTSAALIDTPVGTMRGSYKMKAVDGEEFEAPIEEFMLAIPNVLH